MKILCLGFLFFWSTLANDDILEKLDQIKLILEQTLNMGVSSNTFDFFPFYKKSFNKTVKNGDFEPAINHLLERIKNGEMIEIEEPVKKKYNEIFSSENPNFSFYLAKRFIEYCKAKSCQPGKILKRTFPRFLKSHLADISNIDDPSLSLRDQLLLFNYTKPVIDIKPGAEPKVVQKLTQQISFLKLNLGLENRNARIIELKNDTFKALAKLPNYNGISYSGQNTYPNIGKILKKQNEICWRGFLSTSKEKYEAAAYAQGKKSSYLFSIKSLSGKDISRFSSMPGEEEVLFLPYRRFKIIENPLPMDPNDQVVQAFGPLSEVKMVEVVGDRRKPCINARSGRRIYPE